MRQPLTGCNHTQNQGSGSEERVGLHSRHAHNDVARYFDENEGDKEDPEANVVAIIRHVKALLQSFDSGIGDWTQSDMSCYVVSACSTHYLCGPEREGCM